MVITLTSKIKTERVAKNKIHVKETYHQQQEYDCYHMQSLRLVVFLGLS